MYRAAKLLRKADKVLALDYIEVAAIDDTAAAGCQFSLSHSKTLMPVLQ